MGRLGLAPEAVVDAVRTMVQWKRIIIEGVMTHFADADHDQEFTAEQIRRFRTVLELLRAGGVWIPLSHAANSAAILSGDAAHFDMSHPGIMLYGYPPSLHLSQVVDLRPVLTWKTRTVQIKSLGSGVPISYGQTFITKRDSRIAVLSVGYADGESRSLSNIGMVLIEGRRAPIVGRICMDFTMVDITDHPRGSVGDEVILIGQQGKEVIFGPGPCRSHGHHPL